MVSMKNLSCVVLLLSLAAGSIVAQRANLKDPYDPFEWEPVPDKIAVMLTIAHADDERHMGATLTHYAAVRKVPTVCVLMTSGIDAQPTAGRDGGSIREEEMLKACNKYQMNYRPFFGRFADACYSQMDGFDAALPCSWRAWGNGNEEEGKRLTVGYLVGLIRRYKPDVIVTHDFRGEYGHGNHLGTAFATAYAYDAAGDPEQFPEQLDTVDVWQPKKIYIHMLDIRTAENDSKIPGPAISTHRHYWNEQVEGTGKTAQQFADEGAMQHVSQGDKRCCDDNSTHFGLYKSEVGPDEIGENDFLENLNTGVYSDNQPPAPPSGLEVSEITSSSCRLTWIKPADSDIEKYLIYSAEADDPLMEVSVELSATEVEGLDEETTYSIYMTSVDSAGNESDPGDTVQVATSGTVVSVFHQPQHHQQASSAAYAIHAVDGRFLGSSSRSATPFGVFLVTRSGNGNATHRIQVHIR